MIARFMSFYKPGVTRPEGLAWPEEEQLPRAQLLVGEGGRRGVPGRRRIAARERKRGAPAEGGAAFRSVAHWRRARDMEAGGSRPQSSPASSLYLSLKDVKVEDNKIQDNKIQGLFCIYSCHMMPSLGVWT